MKETDVITPTCPHCGCPKVVFKERVQQWECLDCEKRFTSDTSVDIHRRLTDRAKQPRHIFFSYGHDHNRELIDKFRLDLEKRGHKVWIDFKEIGVWDDWKGRITQGIYDRPPGVRLLFQKGLVDWVRNKRRHTVVCGLWPKGHAIAERCRKTGQDVVIICNDLTEDLRAASNRYGVPVLVGDATDPDVLTQAAVGRAAHVVSEYHKAGY